MVREALTAGVVLLLLGVAPPVVGDAPDGAPYALGEILPVAVVVEPGVDGVTDITIRGTVYLPDVPDTVRVPVVMDMGPYYGQILGSETYEYDAAAPPRSAHADLLKRGYAIALVSVRGTGQSGGCFMVGGAQERADVAAVVEWLADQPWSNGNVGMTGVSYDGTTPWEGLVSGAAPSLKAIVPVEAISDFYRYSFFEGVPIGGGAAFNTYYEAEVDATYTSPTGVHAWAPTMATHLCPEQAQVYAHPYETYATGVHDAYWDERDMSAMLDNASAAVFVVHGTKDFNVKMDHAQTIWEKLPGPKRMLVGQWGHGLPWRNPPAHLRWMEYNDTIAQFFDAYLKEDPVALAAEQAAPPVIVQDSAGVDQHVGAWPPPTSVATPFWLGAARSLSTSPPSPGQVAFEGSPIRMATGPGQDAALDLVLTPPEVRFQTPRFTQPTRFVGNPWIELTVTVDRPVGMIEARLYENTELISMGWQNLATRTSREHAEPVPVGEPMRIRIQMEGIAQVVDPSHYLRLYLSASNTETLTPHPEATRYTVELGGEDGAVLWLPAFSGE